MQLNVNQNTPSNLKCCVTMAKMLRSQKKAKTDHILIITIGYFHSKHGSFKPNFFKKLKILLDTCCGATLIHHNLVGKLKQKNKLSNQSTKAESFITTKTM